MTVGHDFFEYLLTLDSYLAQYRCLIFQRQFCLVVPDLCIERLVAPDFESVILNHTIRSDPEQVDRPDASTALRAIKEEAPEGQKGRH